MKKRPPVYLFMTKAGRICVATDGDASIYDGPIETLIAHVRREYTTIYMPGMACNMWLADKVYTECADRAVLWMLGPRYCRESETADNPQRILHAMKKCTAGASVGGWIQVTSQVILALRCCLNRSKVVGTDIHRQLPFWKDMEFLDFVDPCYLINLVALVRDPRWFLSTADTGGYRKLSLYLGLTPHNMAAAMQGESRVQQIRRCHTTLRVWQPADSPPPDGELRPSQFLWGVWRKHDNPVLANLRATQAFVEYLVRVWHKRLFPEGHPHAALLFDPAAYFTKEIAGAYKSHLVSAG